MLVSIHPARLSIPAYTPPPLIYIRRPGTNHPLLNKTNPPSSSNGGRDVFVDIGDKSWGVTVCQKYFEKQSLNSGSSTKLQFGPENTLHVGDQFLSAGSNDFKARSVGTTAWIASPAETVELLDELADLMQKRLS